MPTVLTLPPVEHAQRSDPGRDPDKQINEDVAAYKATRFGHLCVVCDGMGGHAGGREAATLALSTIGEVFETAADTVEGRDVLKTAIEEANRRVFAMGPMTPGAGRPGSTAVALLLHPKGVEIAHVGDSRAYRIHQGQTVQITKDHSMVQQMVDAGVLTAAQAAVHPDANKITRALGMVAEVEVEVRPLAVPHVAGDTFVLCSDGLSDLVAPDDILQIAGSLPPGQAVGQLVDLANARGGHDNITVMILRARESASVSLREVSPTVAQTVVDAPRPPEPRHTVPTLAQTPAPSPVAAPPRAKSSHGILIAGLALALIGVAALAVAVYLHLSPKKRAATGQLDPIFAITSDAAVNDAAVTIAQVAPIAPIAPIAPLTPLTPLEPGDAGAVVLDEDAGPPDSPDASGEHSLPPLVRPSPRRGKKRPPPSPL